MTHPVPGANQSTYSRDMIDDARMLTVFPDTNVLIQGRALHTLPWEELNRSVIEVVICGPVINELDRLKNKGGRAGKVARTMSTTVRELLKAPGKSDTIRPSMPRVTRRLQLGLGVRHAVRNGLDLTHDDQAIINQALAAVDAGADVILLTDDNFAAMTAEEFGLPVMFLPADWLKASEPDNGAKEIAKRDAVIARLEAAEPVLKLRFADLSGNEIKRIEATIKRYLPVPAEAVDNLMHRVETIAPRADVTSTKSVSEPEARQTTGTQFDLASIRMRPGQLLPVTQDDINEYRSEYDKWLKGVRAKIAGFHVEWNRRREWPSAQLLADNEGSRPAENVLVEISANGSFALSGEHDEDRRPSDGPGWLELDLPPDPPRERPYVASSLRIFDQLNNPPVLSRPYLPDFSHPKARIDDKFYWRSGRSRPVETMELECKIWRHGRGDEAFGLHLHSNDKKPVGGLIVAQASASNLTVPAEARIIVKIEFESGDTGEMAERLVTDLERRLRP
jgi:rRNA-processing protein FCF1